MGRKGTRISGQLSAHWAEWDHLARTRSTTSLSVLYVDLSRMMNLHLENKRAWSLQRYRYQIDMSALDLLLVQLSLK